MNKTDYLSRVSAARHDFKESGLGKIKDVSDQLDDELSCRLFQVFPGNWSDKDRRKGMAILIVHMTIFSYYLLAQRMTKRSIAILLKNHLRKDLGYTIAVKYLYRFVHEVDRLILWHT